MNDVDPATRRRRLRNELRRLRVDARLTQRTVADQLDWSTSKLIRIESGAVAVSPADVRVMLIAYGVSDRERIDELVDLARESRGSSWSDYRDILTPAATDYYGFESSATLLRHFETMLVPGLLQTEEYARSLLAGGLELSDTSAQRHVEVRLQRQELLDRETPPEIFVVLDESVARRVVGGPAVMRHQLERLLELGQRPHLSVQVLPFAMGATPAVRGPFSILEFPMDDPIVYLEGNNGSTVKDDWDAVGSHLDRFFQLERLALSQADSAELLRAAAAGLVEQPAEVPRQEDVLLRQHFVL